MDGKIGKKGRGYIIRCNNNISCAESGRGCFLIVPNITYGIEEQIKSEEVYFAVVTAYPLLEVGKVIFLN